MTIEDRKNAILDKIEELQSESIPTSELEAAYKEGVDSV